MNRTYTDRAIANACLRIAELELQLEAANRAEDYYESYLQAKALAAGLQKENDFLRDEIESLRMERKNGHDN